MRLFILTHSQIDSMNDRIFLLSNQKLVFILFILQVMRVLPEWLSHPTIVEHDLTHNQIAVDEYTLISTKIAAALKQNDITHLFPGKLTHSVCYSSNF